MSECQTKAGNQNTLSLTLILSLSTCCTTFVFFSMLKSHTISNSLTFSLSHSHTLSFTLSRHAEQLLFSCLGLKVTLSLSHSLTLSHSLIHSSSHSFTLDMLNNFCFHLYAQKSLFMAENCNAFFDSILILP